jgi:tRNA A-37 threonylcarbamoyl transferase component Bud32
MFPQALRPKPTMRNTWRDDLEMIWSWWDGGARLRNVLAAFDPSHQSFELLRRLGAQIGVVHSAQLLGDGE